MNNALAIDSESPASRVFPDHALLRVIVDIGGVSALSVPFSSNRDQRAMDEERKSV